MVAQQAGTVTLAGVRAAAVRDRAAARRLPTTRASRPDPTWPAACARGDRRCWSTAGRPTLAPAAQGGTGKTQLAVEFAHAMWNTRAVEVLVWVTAASRESVVTGFAQAANMVDASLPDEGAEAAAARFVSWLAHTRRPWALILDDLAELSDLEDLWPAGASGRVLITTRLPAAAFEDPAWDVQGRPGARAEPPRGPGLPQPPGSPTTPTSGSRRWTWARTWTGCRSRWPRPPR